jgi:ZIP family zinc transporter
MPQLALIALAAFAATFVGGAFALAFRDKLHLILGFSAGAVAGVAIFDLLPEAFARGMAHHEASTVAFFVALGFFTYLVLDRLILIHTHDDEGHAEAGNLPRGIAGALTLAAHSFFDGFAIGASFQVSAALGLVVTLAVLAHDLSDGINTASLIVKNGGSRTEAFCWLLVDALAPATGILVASFVAVPQDAIGLLLAVFAGTFLYLSASDLIPESHHQHPRALTALMTLAGAALIGAVVMLAR